jgi:hypothetical protein
MKSTALSTFGPLLIPKTFLSITTRMNPPPPPAEVTFADLIATVAPFEGEASEGAHPLSAEPHLTFAETAQADQ